METVALNTNAHSWSQRQEFVSRVITTPQITLNKTKAVATFYMSFIHPGCGHILLTILSIVTTFYPTTFCNQVSQNFYIPCEDILR